MLACYVETVMVLELKINFAGRINHEENISWVVPYACNRISVQKYPVLSENYRPKTIT